jgi:hypothetical protein
VKRTSVWLAAAALAVAPAALADDSGVYLGAAVGFADGPDNVRVGVPDVPLLAGKADVDDPGFGVSAGYRFNKNLSLELGYVDLDELQADVADAASDGRATLDFSAQGVTLAMIGELPIGKWQPYLKAGVFYSRTVIEYSGAFSGAAFSARLTSDNEDALYGIGVRYQLSDGLRLFVDATYFMEVGEPGKGQVDFLNHSAGVVWQF